jgi:hypothetical protein
MNGRLGLYSAVRVVKLPPGVHNFGAVDNIGRSTPHAAIVGGRSDIARIHSPEWGKYQEYVRVGGDTWLTLRPQCR